MDEPIRSHLPNENYRRGWDETFGTSRDIEPDGEPESHAYRGKYVLTTVTQEQRRRFLFGEWDCEQDG